MVLAQRPRQPPRIIALAMNGALALLVAQAGACSPSGMAAPVVVVSVQALEPWTCDTHDDEPEDDAAQGTPAPDGHPAIARAKATFGSAFRRGALPAHAALAAQDDRTLRGCPHRFVHDVAHHQTEHAAGEQAWDVATWHSAATDPLTGADVWHTDWQWGECVVVDGDGYPRVVQAWHRHPLGTGYAELMR